MEAAVDDDRVEVFARDGRRFDGDVRNVFGAVEESIGVGEFFAGSEFDGAFGSEARELFDGLIDRDELGSFDKSLACFKVAVLAGDEDLAGVTSLGECVDGFACEGIVTAHDGVGFGDLIEMLVDEFVSELGLPAVAVVFEGDVHVVLIADGVEAVHYLGNVVV